MNLNKSAYYMRVINFISGKDLGGPKQSFVLYTEVFSKLGLQVESFVKKDASLIPLLKSKNYAVHEVNYIRSTHPLIINRTIKQLRTAFLKYSTSVFFVHKQIDVELLRKALGDKVKIVAIVHGYNAKHLKYANQIIAVSKKVKDFLIHSGCSQRIYIVPNMVKIENLPIYKKLPKTPLIGAMGIHRRKKGFHILIRALSILKQKNIRFNAVIAGKGRITWYLKYLRNKLDLQNELSFKGWISNEEREDFIDNIDLYVLPSRTETFGMVVVEAMARMKIVIATKCGGPEEIIENNINGFLVQKENPEALAEKLEDIIKNYGNYKNIPYEANKTALKNYSVQSIEKTLLEITQKASNV